MNLQSSLAQKYSKYHAYYYTKSLNEYLDNARLSHVINFHYETNCDQHNEYLRRTYNIHEISTKLTFLIEYYKFHNEIPRCFLLKLAGIMSSIVTRVNTFILVNTQINLKPVFQFLNNLKLLILQNLRQNYINTGNLNSNSLKSSDSY